MPEAATRADHDEPLSWLDVRVEHRFVGRESCAQHRPNVDGVDVVWQDADVTRIQRNVLLERPLLMVQVVCALDAVLFGAGETGPASTADAACETNPYVLAEAKVF